MKMPLILPSDAGHNWLYQEASDQIRCWQQKGFKFYFIEKQMGTLFHSTPLGVGTTISQTLVEGLKANQGS